MVTSGIAMASLVSCKKILNLMPTDGVTASEGI